MLLGIAEGTKSLQVADGVEDALPQGFSVAMVRHVFQHLNLKAGTWTKASSAFRAPKDYGTEGSYRTLRIL